MIVGFNGSRRKFVKELKDINVDYRVGVWMGRVKVDLDDIIGVCVGCYGGYGF